MPKGCYRDPSNRHHWRLAARRIGCSLEEYAARRNAGQRWCYACRRWRPEARFGPDAHRPKKIDGTCIECRKLLDDARGDRRAHRNRRAVTAELEEVSNGVHHD